MSFDPGGGGIANANDVALNNPADGQMLAYTAALAKWQNYNPTPAHCYATFVWDGTTATARKQLDNSLIASGSTPATVLQAAVTAAGNAGGGFVALSSGTIPISAPIVMPANTGLFGMASVVSNTSSPTVNGTVLKASGSLTTTDAIIEVGDSVNTVAGVILINLGLDGNNQAMCWHSINGNCPQLQNCMVINGNPICLWFESTKAPNPFPGGGFGARVIGCSINGGSGGGTCLKASGTGCTDGIIANCSMNIKSATVGCDVGGGWIIVGSHLTGNTTTTATIILNGANCIVTGNYLDTAKAGYNLVINQPMCAVTGNYILNGSGTLHCVQVVSSQCTITGNVLDTNAAGYGIVWNGLFTSLPKGAFSNNYCSGLDCFVDKNNTTMPATNTATCYIAGNVHS